jgi:hypothetical protein
LFRRAVETILPEQIYESIDGARVLTLFQPLRNLKECQACHGTDHEVRGVLQISLGLEKLDAQILAARNRQILVALVTIVAVTVTLLIAMGRLVLQPVARVAAAGRVATSPPFGRHSSGCVPRAWKSEPLSVAPA